MPFDTSTAEPAGFDLASALPVLPQGMVDWANGVQQRIMHPLQTMADEAKKWSSMSATELAQNMVGVGHTGWHGSPHLFDKFKSEAIGTGGSVAGKNAPELKMIHDEWAHLGGKDHAFADKGLISANVPQDIAQEMYGWPSVNKSPFSYSYYDNPDKSWTYTKPDSLRVADHWNFKTDEPNSRIHATTDIPVPDKHWAIGKYDADKGIYNIQKISPPNKVDGIPDLYEHYWQQVPILERNGQPTGQQPFDINSAVPQ